MPWAPNQRHLMSANRSRRGASGWSFFHVVLHMALVRGAERGCPFCQIAPADRARGFQGTAAGSMMGNPVSSWLRWRYARHRNGRWCALRHSARARRSTLKKAGTGR